MKYKLLFSVLLLWILLPFTTHAADFVGLVGIPGIEPTGDTDLNAYINALYRLSISIAALLAVVKIVAAGAKYMLSDIITHKEDAKKDIQGALIGLLIVIGAIIILNTINTDLTRLNLTVATTTIQQGPTFQEVLAAQQQAIANLASSTNSREMIFTCAPGIGGVGGNIYYQSPDEGAEAACQRVCREFRGQYTDNWSLTDATGDTCRFAEGPAAQCNPNMSGNCCATINGATWNAGPPTSCSGLAEARAASALACGREGRIWDTAGNYCRVASCNVNTDVNCCAARGGTIQNNVCSVTNEGQGTVEQDRNFCRQQGNIWTEPNGPCIPNNGRTVVPGSEFPIPPFVADLDPNVPSELNQINGACQGGGIDYVYSPELNQCVIYQ